MGLRFVPLFLVLSSGTAIAETKISANVNVAGGYASNPFLSSGDGTGTANVTANIQPNISFDDATNSFSLTGNAGRTVYSNRYGSNGNYSVQSAFNKQLSPRSSFSVSAGYSSVQQNALQPVLSPIPIPDTGVDILDPSAVQSLGQTVRTLNGSGSFTTQFSSRTSFSVQGFGAKVMYPERGTTAQDYTTYGGGLNVSHTLNDRITIGPGVSYSRSDYKESTFGSSSQISPTLNVSFRFPSRLRLALSGGATFSQIDQAGFSSNKTSLAGSANLCRDGDRASICIDARQSTSPTAFSGLSNVTSFGLNYSYRLTPRSTLGLSASYSKTSTLDKISSSNAQNGSYGTANANYSRQMTERLSFNVNAAYTDSFEQIVARKANIYGSVGISYRLGRRS